MMLLNKKLIFALLTLAALPAIGQVSCPANITGKTMMWVVAVCQSRLETDDFESPAVQKCIADVATKDAVPKDAPPLCKLNAKYKHEWCDSLVKIEAQKSVSSCVKSNTVLPTVVRNGHIGN